MKAIPFVLFLLILLSCKDTKEKAPVKTAVASSSTSAAKAPYVPEVRYGPEGYYTGEFTLFHYDGNKETFNNQVTLCIDSMNKDIVFGHSIVAGNNRPFKGAYKKTEEGYEAKVSEPGDNIYDGRFDLTIYTKERMIRGRWVAANTELPVKERTFALKWSALKYDPELMIPDDLVGKPIYGPTTEEDESEVITSNAISINASKTLLKTKQVENLYKADLEVIRNSIYARHGYSFKNLRMRTLFDNEVPWYMPVSTDVTAQLTPIEKKNIALIKRYEAHAEKYYDSFGR